MTFRTLPRLIVVFILLCISWCRPAWSEVADLHGSAAIDFTWAEAELPATWTVDDVRRASSIEWRNANADVATPRRLPAGQVLWTRFVVAPYGALVPPTWTLQFPRPGLDRVELYRFVNDELELHEVSGDSIPVAGWPIAGRYPAFELVPAHWDPVVYYVRVAHAGAFTMRADLEPRDQAIRRQRLRSIALGAVLGPLLCITLLSAASAHNRRGRLHLSLAAYGIALMASLLAVTGLLGELMPELPSEALHCTPAIAIMVTASLGLLHLVIASSLRRVSRALSWIVLSVAAAGAASVVTGFTVLAIPLVDLATAYLVLLCCLAAAVLEAARRRGDRWSGTQLLLLLPMLGVLAVPAGESLQALPLTADGIFVICLCCLLHMAGQYLAIGAKVGSLTEAAARLQASQTVDLLTGLLNYRGLLGRVPGLVHRAERSDSQAAVLLIELSPVGWLSPGSGLRRQEHAVVRAADLIRVCARDNDIVARIDDTHFVVAIEAPASLRAATDMASLIVAKGLRVGSERPHYLPLAFRIVISMASARSEPVDSILGVSLRRLRTVPADNPRRIFVEFDPVHQAA